MKTLQKIIATIPFLFFLLFGAIAPTAFCAETSSIVESTMPNSSSVQVNVNTNKVDTFINDIILGHYSQILFGGSSTGGIIGRIIGGLSVVVIMYSGVMYITARGTDQSKKAKATIVNVLLGLLIYIMSAGIIEVIIGLARYFAK